MSTDFPEQFFQRQDESPDGQFYSDPRFVTHIDDSTIQSLTQFYREQLSAGSRVLDLMSSWISHLPEEVSYARVAGLGMNSAELEANARLDEHFVQDLNTTPGLPFENDSFDAVLIAVSIQYLVQPVAVMTEIERCLVPGGQCIVAMSHRLFPTKAIYAFQVLPPAERCQVVASYMERGGLSGIKLHDRSPDNGDPLWIIQGHCR